MGDKGETGGSAQMLEEAVGVATVTQGAREGAAEIRAQISPRPWALKNRKGQEGRGPISRLATGIPPGRWGIFHIKPAVPQDGPG